MFSQSRTRLIPRPISLARSLPLALLCTGALISCDNAAPVAEDPEVAQTAAALSVSPLARKLKSIDVTPANSTLLVDLGAKGTRAFKVTAHYTDKSTADVTATATYTLDNPAVGTIAAGVFTSAVQTTAQVAFASLAIKYTEGGVAMSTKTSLTVAWLHTAGTSPDILLTLPYHTPSKTTTLALGTNVQSLDAFFAVDTTGSMGGEINEIRRSLDATILPAVQAAVKDAWVGVGAVEDFPSGSYGSPGCGPGTDDQPFILLSAMTGDFVGVKTAFDALLRGSSPRGCGNDLPEGQFEALYQIATGNGNVVPAVVNIPPHHDKGHGGVEFRDGALPVVTLISDASFHTLGEPTRMCFGNPTDYAGPVAMAAHSRADTTAALKNVCARAIGLSADVMSDPNCIATGDMRQLATDTGAVVPPQAWDATGTRPMGCAAGQCCTGLAGIGETPNADGLCPLVMHILGDGLGSGQGVADAITQLVHFAPSDVVLSATGKTTGEDGTSLPAGKTTADFLGGIKALDGTAPTLPAGLKAPVVSGDHFTGVIPGSALRFSFDAKNEFLASGPKPQVFRAKLQTLASGCATLDTRDVLIIVPAT